MKSSSNLRKSDLEEDALLSSASVSVVVIVQADRINSERGIGVLLCCTAGVALGAVADPLNNHVGR
jgi:hypothetical protein